LAVDTFNSEFGWGRRRERSVTVPAVTKRCIFVLGIGVIAIGDVRNEEFCL
jgi:hypothetical protein